MILNNSNQDEYFSTCPEEYLLSDGLDADLNSEVDRASEAIAARTARLIFSCPRTMRVVKALLKDKIMREDLDKIAGSSNSPDIVFRLRQKGLEITCLRIDSKDIDGKRCRPGRYEFTKSDKEIITEWMTLQ